MSDLKPCHCGKLPRCTVTVRGWEYGCVTLDPNHVTIRTGIFGSELAARNVWNSIPKETETLLQKRVARYAKALGGKPPEPET